MMAEYLRVGRLYFVLLAIFTFARVVQGATGFAYENVHHVFSIVILTLFSSTFFAIFCRRWRGWRLLQAVGLGVLFAVAAQLVLFLATVVSYAVGADTFFNHPRALNVEGPIPLGQALVVRARGLVVFPIVNAIAASLGWALGGLLPAASAAKAGAAAPAAAAPRAAV